MIDVQQFIDDQLESWPLAAENYRALQNVRQRTLEVDRDHFVLQYNPSRIRSTAAKVEKALYTSECFLCAKNRPAEQKAIPWRDYDILVNPYPIFPKHLTIASIYHTPQTLFETVGDMLDLAIEMPDMAIFYNGAKCGASMPSHLHFQAGNVELWPFLDDLKGRKVEIVLGNEFEGVTVACCDDKLRMTYKISLQANNVNKEYYVERWIDRILLQYYRYHDMASIITTCIDGLLEVYVVPRRDFRPKQYFAEGDAKILVSPATVEIGGTIITPREEDFQKITNEDIKSIFEQVCL